jgi:branched-chain amino acid transport system ATP-binding protein
MPDVRPSLEFRDVGILFGSVGVIESLRVKLQAGSRTAIIGPNGAGKTTLFNLLSGVYTPTYGAILLDGENIVDVPLAKRVHCGIGRTLQNPRLMKHLTILENVMLGQHHLATTFEAFVPLVSRFNRKPVNEALAAIEAVGLAAESNRLADGLSYGMQKRVELARALATKPKLLLLDEPAAGLNTAERNELLSALKASIKPDVTLLLIEHDLGFIGELCEHVIAMHFGRVIAEGTLTEVERDPAVVDAYLGANGPTVEANCAA